MSRVTNVLHMPMFDGHASSLANYEEKVTSRNQISTSDPQKRAANLLWHMTDSGREACMSVGKDVIGNADGAAHILRISRERFAPDAIDSTFQDVAKCALCKHAYHKSDAFLMEFDMLGQQAEAHMLLGGGFPDEFAPAVCAQNAALSENGKTLALARFRNAEAFPEVSAQMRRLLGPRGYAMRQDVLVAADTDAAPEGEDCEAWVAYR